MHKLAEEPDRRVQATFNKTTKKLDLRALHHATDVIMPDGSKGRRIIVDARDVGELPKIIQRERKRHGVPPLSEETLAEEARKAAENIVIVNNPQVLIEKSFSFAYLRHAMIKIAYELAFMWLGESYLDDLSAAELRTAICTPDQESTNRLAAWVGEAESCEAFTKLWGANKTHHLAYAWTTLDGISIAVRVFDIYAAIVWVMRDAKPYLSGHDAGEKLRFLAIDPANGIMCNTPLMAELSRIARVTTASYRQAPSDMA